VIARWKSFATLLLLATGLVATLGSAPKHTPPVPVLVELFTSEGCSSCPPADRLLQRYLRDQPVPGAQVVAIAEHVDYWNGPGWTDRFSQAQFTSRQSEYVRALGETSAYTPQMVVDGAAGFVGSNAMRAMQAIALAAKAPKRPITVTCPGSKSGAEELEIDMPAGPGATGQIDIYAALVEDNLASQVTGGENQGERLTHAAVARCLVRVGHAAAADGFSSTVSLPIGSAWQRPGLRAVVFAADSRSRHVLGVATTPAR